MSVKIMTWKTKMYTLKTAFTIPLSNRILLYFLQAFFRLNLRNHRCFNKIYFEPPVFHYVKMGF